jgi:lipopolysaccharide/colanic/teichoic acid biosynthesis glycosyltransferase
LLILVGPIMIGAMFLVRLTSRGPAIYCQTRSGRDGRPFRIYKIRTMYHDCERMTGPQWSRPGDPRVTPVGRILRATHIDELPQLWNILCLEMTLVGPRPERPEIVAKLEPLLPAYRDRLLIRPGVTGLAQVQLPPDADLESVRRKLLFDLYYIRHASPWLDLRLMIGTALGVVGIPARVTRWLLALPGLEAVEAAFHDRPDAPDATTDEMDAIPGHVEPFAHATLGL